MHRQGGFILVLVLAMLVVLSLLAGSIASVSARLLEQALQRQNLLQDEIDIASTKATLYYLLSTQPMTVAGLTVDSSIVTARSRAETAGLIYEFSAVPVGGEVGLDGSIHAGLGQTRFALQDDRGLFGVKLQPETALQRLITTSSGKQDAPAKVLIDRLIDYQDKDDLYRLNSMEKQGYAKLGLPPPTNRPLTTPLELMRIPGWPEALSGMSSATINGTITVETSGLINVNTAPVAVLRTLPGVDEGMARRVVARRKVQPFLTDRAFYEFLALTPGMDSAISMYPSTSGTLRLWGSRGGQVQLVHWALTPADDGGKPWREDYELIHSQDRWYADTPLPVRSRLFTQQVVPQRGRLEAGR